MPPTLGLVMIVRDEARNLPLSLGPVAGLFDDLVVMDTGSRDGTPTLAESFGARVFFFEWVKDFSAARNASIEQAKAQWLLWLDADNRIDPSGVREIRRHIDQARKSIFWATELVTPSGERLLQKRVFPNRPEVRFSGQVHEQLVHPASFGQKILSVEIRHWGYADKAGAREKGLRNLALLRDMVKSQPDNPYLAYQLGKTLLNLRRFEDAGPWLEQGMTFGLEAENPGLYRHAHLLLAQVWERLGRMEDAENLLKDLARKIPDYGPVWSVLGRIANAKGDLKNTVRCMEEFLRLGVNDPLAGFNETAMIFSAWMILGQTLERLGQTREAEAAYRHAARLEPHHPEPQLALAEMALNRDQRDMAGEYLARVQARHPGLRRVQALRRKLEQVDEPI